MAIPTSHALAAVWSDDALYFCTGPGEQKYANLRADPHVILMTAATAGRRDSTWPPRARPSRVTDSACPPSSPQAWAAKWDGQWQFQVRDGRFERPEGGTAHVFRGQAAKVLAFAEGRFGQRRPSPARCGLAPLLLCRGGAVPVNAASFTPDLPPLSAGPILTRLTVPVPPAGRERAPRVRVGRILPP